VSPSWNETIRVSLCPDRVGLVRRDRRKRMLEARVVECRGPEAGRLTWEPALEAFREGLAALDRKSSAISVVLSNHFVRYTLVPWNGQLKGPEEQLAHTRHCFEQVFGSAAATWDVRLSNGAEGETQVACAVDAGLLSALDKAVASHGLKLRSVQPYLMTAFNQWRQRLDGPQVWFVLAEQDRVCLSTLLDGAWSDLQNLYAGPGWAQELPVTLARQRLLGDLDTQAQVYVCATDESAEQVLLAAGENVHSLRLPPTAGVAAGQAGFLAMAMCG
jgi:hypothetical protein